KLQARVQIELVRRIWQSRLTGTGNSLNAKADAYLQQPLTTCLPRSMLTPHTLTDYCHSQFSKSPTSSLLLLYAVTNKSDFRQIPWILHLPLHRATLLYALSVT